MYTSEKRRLRDAEKRVERLHYKFVNDYVKALHGDIYEKAEELYQSTRQKYPSGVKDLTKTYEFMNTVTPQKPVPRYYMSRKTKEKTTMKRMVLEIPLLPPQAVSSPHPSPPQAVSSPHPSPPQAVSSPHPSPPQAVSSPHPSPPQAVSSPHPSPPTTVSLPPLSEEVFQQLLQDIYQDPDLVKILEGFPIDDECMTDTADLQPDIWDSIQPQDISPLQQELSNML